jgi:hypothetical protein
MDDMIRKCFSQLGNIFLELGIKLCLIQIMSIFSTEEFSKVVSSYRSRTILGLFIYSLPFPPCALTPSLTVIVL